MYDDATTRKAINFDLDTRKLKELYPSTSPNGWRQAWAQIESFLKEQGSIHVQYSGYQSLEPMWTNEVFIVMENLQNKYPWFRDCATSADVTIVTDRYNILEYLKNQELKTSTLENQIDSTTTEAHEVETMTLDAVSRESRDAAANLNSPSRQQPNDRDER
ncbi:hypothetical protein [Faecalicoccus pleomorphus]|uniref:Uncharacterized protein n=1 Tax=Faecalicoccus pleomorphus TaxID=1323 RepID=A0AAW6CZD1_9FIRM|nr:hypothetical protein [Faecalicoccus pleomorphus]MDB7980804.1 hypothetical protein [Faecalicoccus pleomorphus]MDB7983020.1 hypothetical protein [Faecalicoccus pleomorphus]MDB7984003.1 hypothetical protein [Faecalicoccus pleomorphus]